MRLIKLYWFISLIFLGACQASLDTEVVSVSEPNAIKSEYVHDDLLELRAGEGLVYFNGIPFSGSSMKLYSREKIAGLTEYKEGIKNGISKKWFEDGTLSYEANYKDGELHGMSRTWFRNKQLRSESSFVNGIGQGMQKQYYQSGTKFKYILLVDGIEEGLQQSWRENGKLYNNYESKNGRIFGLKRSKLCYTLKDEVVQYKKT